MRKKEKAGKSKQAPGSLVGEIFQEGMSWWTQHWNANAREVRRESKIAETAAAIKEEQAMDFGKYTPDNMS